VETTPQIIIFVVPNTTSTGRRKRQFALTTCWLSIPFGFNVFIAGQRKGADPR